MKLIKFEVNRGGVGAMLADPEMRKVLKPFADQVLAAIPQTDGNPEERYSKKKGRIRVSGSYKKKYLEESTANDGRVGYKVGVTEANHSFFTLMTLQKAIRAVGGKGRRARKK